MLKIVFLTRIITVDMVLWDDTGMVPCDSRLWQYSAHVVAGTTEYATRAGSFRRQISVIRSKRALFPYKRFLSCELQCS